MNLPTIRDEHHVPARPGQRVLVQAFDREGQITGAHGDYLAVSVPGIRSTVHVHPTDLTYLKG